MKEYISNSLENTRKIAEDFAFSLGKQNYESALVVGLYGELGAGKTTFMKYFAQALGVKETIQSPTFVIMKKLSLKGASKKAQVQELSNFTTLFHIDAYRLDSGEDLLKLGWRELISDPKNLICIEWPERVAEILPEHIMVRFEHVKDSEQNGESQDEGQRKISIA